MIPPSDIVTITISRAEMRRRGLRGAAMLHAKYNPVQLTRAARTAFQGKFEREADPDGALDPDERAHRVAKLRRAHYQRLGRLGAEARRARRQAREGGAA